MQVGVNIRMHLRNQGVAAAAGIVPAIICAMRRLIRCSMLLARRRSAVFIVLLSCCRVIGRGCDGTAVGGAGDLMWNCDCDCDCDGDGGSGYICG